MIAAVHFRNFKAQRSAALRLAPFNLILGPNSSGRADLPEGPRRVRTLVPWSIDWDAGGALCPDSSGQTRCYVGRQKQTDSRPSSAGP